MKNKRPSRLPNGESLNPFILMHVLYKDVSPVPCDPMDCDLYHAIIRQFVETFRKLQGVTGK